MKKVILMIICAFLVFTINAQTTGSSMKPGSVKLDKDTTKATVLLRNVQEMKTEAGAKVNVVVSTETTSIRDLQMQIDMQKRMISNYQTRLDVLNDKLKKVRAAVKAEAGKQ